MGIGSTDELDKRDTLAGRKALLRPAALTSASVALFTLSILLACASPDEPARIPFSPAATPTVEEASGPLIVGGGGYSSINAAVSAASPGDTILIHAGAYPEQVGVNKSVTIKGFGDGAVWIDGGCSRDQGIVISADNVTVQGIGVKKANEANIVLDGASNVTLEGLTVQVWNCAGVEADQYRAGIASWGGGKNLTVRGSYLERRVELSGPDFGFGNGIWIKNTGPGDGGGHVITGNTIVGGYDGIGGEPEDESWGGFNKGAIIEGNTISDCGDDGIQVEGGTANVVVQGNVIKRCLIGIAFAPALTGPLTIARNVISEPEQRYDLGPAMFKVGDSSVGEVRVYHNSFFAGSTAADGLKQTNPQMENIHLRNNAIYASRYVIETTWHTGAVTADYDALYTTDSERFVKWGDERYYSTADLKNGAGQEANGKSLASFGWDGELRPQAGSPLIDAGVLIPGFNDGFSGSAPDIGAFEYGSGSAPPPPASSSSPPPSVSGSTSSSGSSSQTSASSPASPSPPTLQLLSTSPPSPDLPSPSSAPSPSMPRLPVHMLARLLNDTTSATAASDALPYQPDDWWLFALIGATAAALRLFNAGRQRFRRSLA